MADAWFNPTIQSGAIVSGLIASGQVGQGHYASGSVQGSLAGTSTVASGTFGPNDLGSGSILSGHLASGQVGAGHLSTDAVLSGSVASGQLGTDHHASGTVVTNTNAVIQFQSGTGYSVITEEPISGGRAVALSPSGRIRIAMASVSGRMPAVGVLLSNTLSGIQPSQIILTGFHQFTSGLNDYSGYLAGRVWVGRSGHIVTTSGSWNSGGHLSGDIGQLLGNTVNSGGVLFNIVPMMVSGGPLGIQPGGPF